MAAFVSVSQAGLLRPAAAPTAPVALTGAQPPAGASQSRRLADGRLLPALAAVVAVGSRHALRPRRALKAGRQAKPPSSGEQGRRGAVLAGLVPTVLLGTAATAEEAATPAASAPAAPAEASPVATATPAAAPVVANTAPAPAPAAPVAPKVTRPPSAPEMVNVYFGGGNFFHLQHTMVLKEANELLRRGEDISAITGYAGGSKAGLIDTLCYYPNVSGPEYKSQGHSQVVRVTLPPEKIADFASTYFEEVAGRKNWEQGPQFRAAIGLRGGMKSPYFSEIEKANNGRFQLVAAAGSDKDNFGKGSVYIYDARIFPFRMAEETKQFQDDQPDRFEWDYRQLNPVLLKIGYISSIGCIG